MSHFVVLVIGNNADKQLAPYNEDLREVFNDQTESLLEKYNTSSAPVIPIADGKWQYVSVKEGGTETRFNVMYPTFEAFCADWEDEKPNEDGRYGYMHNPNAKWDWYQVGGRWSGYFKAKPGTAGELGERSWATNEIEPGCYDVIRKGDIDFDAMVAEAHVTANKRYDLYEATVAGLDVPKPWKEFREDFADVDDARVAFSGLPYNVALRAAKLDDWFSDSVATYGVGRDAYVKRAGYNTFIPYAVVQNGEWAAKGEMGYFGMSNETVDESEWCERIAKLLLELPDDTLITAVDCHT